MSNITQKHDRRCLGILGGMGPLAGVYLQQLFVVNSAANNDNEHLNMLCYTNATIPDRTQAIRAGKEEDFIGPVCMSLVQMEAFGVTEIIIPCNTAHVGYIEYQKSVSVPVYNLIEETNRFIAANLSSNKGVLLLATHGVYESDVYVNGEWSHGVSIVYPDATARDKLFSIITAVKANNVQEAKASLSALLSKMDVESFDAILLGCTELSVIGDVLPKDLVVFDPLKIATHNLL